MPGMYLNVRLFALHPPHRTGNFIKSEIWEVAAYGLLANRFAI
jgi:hypothetical protein